MANSFVDLDITKCSDAQKKEALIHAIDARKSEIDRFWSRTLVFWGFVGATFVTYGTLFDKMKDADPTLFIVTCFGFLTSFAWAIQGRGSKYWQEAWENKVAILEKDVLNLNLFSNSEPIQKKWLWGAGRFSVSSLSIALSYLSMFVWIVLAIRAVQPLLPSSVAQKISASVEPWLPLLPAAVAGATILFAVALLGFGRSRN